MQISEAQFNTESLVALGVETVELLRSGNHPALAARFGYALALQRDPAVAIQEDLASCLVKLEATALAPVDPGVLKVRYFPPNDILFAALVEIWISTDNGRRVLVDLIVTKKEAIRHVTLEDISVPI